ncbi:hypothetical protein BDZ45DRAFT_680403 [Acephala macrosclerotiorum]|nr:hypothetical protein BDZ45DRAFT_680403 [Acephala macrosclerotiorum]
MLPGSWMLSRVAAQQSQRTKSSQCVGFLQDFGVALPPADYSSSLGSIYWEAAIELVKTSIRILTLVHHTS